MSVEEPTPADVEAQDDQVQTEVVDDDNGETARAPQYESAPDEAYSDPNANAGGYEPEAVPAVSDEEEYQMKVNGCLVALIVASCAELAQAAKKCDELGQNPLFECNKSYMFAIVVGAVSLGLNALFGGGLYFSPDMFKPYIPYHAIVMVLLWGFGVAVCTFDKPFNDTGNGYFATWGAAVISVYFAQISFSKFNAILGKAFTNALSGTLERRVMMMVMILSYVFAFASVTNGLYPGFTKQEKWGFACGLTSGGLITFYMLFKAFTNMVHGKMIIKWISYVLVALWLFGVGVCTFEAPFTTTGNGYFTAWGSFLGSIYLAYITTMNPSAETPAD